MLRPSRLRSVMRTAGLMAICAVAGGAEVNLNSPATTLTLLKLNAVVGVRGHFNRSGTLSSIGLTCAVCHSTVNNSLAPNLKPVTDLLGVDAATVKKVLAAWGPGKFDAELFLDDKGFRPDGKTAATLIPPAYGLAGVNLHTYTGWGSIPYWNAFVAVLEMHGQGNFTDARLDDAQKFPVAARNRMGHTRFNGDLVASKLPALHFYQLALRAP